MKKDVGSLQKDVSSLKEDVAHNTLMIESLQKDVKIIVEVQQNHMQQNQREFKELYKYINEKSTLLESIAKKTSEEIIELKEERKSIHEILGRHEITLQNINRRLG